MDESLGAWLPTPITELTDLAELLALVVVLAALTLRVLPSTRRWAPRGHGGVVPESTPDGVTTARTGRVPVVHGLRLPSHPSH